MMIATKISLVLYFSQLGTVASRYNMDIQLFPVIKLSQAEDVTFRSAVRDRRDRAKTIALARAAYNNNLTSHVAPL